MKGKKIIQ